MGQQTSQFIDKRYPVRGGIFIQIPKISYLSNEIVAGTLHINLEENFHGHLLMICFFGQEEVHFTYETGNSESSSTHHAKENNRFLNFQFPVYDFAHNDGNPNFVLRPGQWSIPFRFQISDQLTSSMRYLKNENHQCNINYFIHAQIISSNPMCRPVEGMQEIFIAQQLNLGNQQITQNYIAQPTSFFFCGLGSINIKGKINKPSYAPGETIEVQLDCDLTQCSSSILSINIELKGCLTMNTSKREQNIEQFNVSRNSINVSSKKFSSSTALLVPQQILLTANSTFIQLYYKVVVTPVIDSCCLQNLKSLEFIVQINPTPSSFQYIKMPILAQANAPQNWNPQLLQPQQMSEQQALRQQQIQLQNLGNQQQIYQNDQQQQLVQQQQPKMINQI